MTGNRLTALTLVAGLASYANAQVDTVQADTTRPAPSVTPASVDTVSAAPAAAPCTCPPDTSKVPKTPGRFSLLGLLSIPQGDFGDEDEANAILGFGLGAEVLFPLATSQHTNLVFGAYYLRNALDLSDIEDQGVEASGGEWNNVSVMGGLRAYFPEAPGFYAQGMAGLNMASANDATLTEPTFGDEARLKISSGTAFAFSLGVGKRTGSWDIGIRYMNMGEPEFEGTLVYNGVEEDLGTSRMKISVIALSVGYSF